jgi:hypothetical protein
VLEVKRLTDDYDAPDARPALILAAAPSLRGLTLHLDPGTYVPHRAYLCDMRALTHFSFSALDTPSAANRTQSSSASPAPPRRLRRVHRRPTPSVLSVLRLTRPRRPASPPRLLRAHHRSSAPPPACFSLSPPPSASVLADYKIQGHSARIYLVPRGGRRLRSASRTPRMTPPSCLVLRHPCANSRCISRSACVSRAIFTYCMLIPHLPFFLSTHSASVSRLFSASASAPASLRGHGASFALLAHPPFPVSSRSPLPIHTPEPHRPRTTTARARTSPRAQRAARRPPRRCAIEGSAADAEAPSGRRTRFILIATHTIHTRTRTASHPRAAKGVRPTKRS